MLALLALLSAQPGIWIRSSAVDISPPERLALGGYTERRNRLMELGGEPLYARTIVLQQGRERTAIVSVEMLTVPESLVREIRAKVPGDLRLFIAATHTHCAPDSQMLNDRMLFPIPGIAVFQSKWLAWYSDRIASGIVAALGEVPVRATQLDFSTSTPNLNRPRRKGGTPDPTATEISVRGLPLIVQYAAHATIFDAKENATKGDWPGRTMALGGLVLVGAIGDVAPNLDGPDAALRAREFAAKLTGSLSRGSRPFWRAGDPVRFERTPIRLDPKRPSPEFISKNKVPEALAKSLVERFAPDAAEVTALRIGDLALLGVPGEPTGALGLRIRAYGEKLGFKSVLVCSHVNGWIGYILMPEDYDRGGYESQLAFNGRDEALRVEESADRALDALKREPNR